jgi:PAS domain S-box-containing protein
VNDEIPCGRACDDGGFFVELTGTILNQLDQIGDWGLLVTDANLIVTHWNRWLEQRSGLSAGDVVGQLLFEVFPDMVTRRVDRYYRQALTGQTVVLSQRFHKYVIPLPTSVDMVGQTQLQQTSRIIPLMEDKKVSGTLTLIEDVTERVAYEAELRTRARQQAAVAALARSALGGCIMADLAREVVDHVRQTLDVDFVEVVQLLPDGQSWSRLAGYGWSDSEAVPFETASAPRTRHVLAPDGTGTAVDLSQTLLRDDAYLRSHSVADGLIAPVSMGERLFGFVGAYTRYRRPFSPGEFLFAQALADVIGVAAERNRLEGELHLRIWELAEQDKRKDEFLAMLAHELRNPLAPVKNALQTLRLKHSADPTMNRLTEMMSRQIGQIVRLVDDLLDVSRITRGKVTLRMEQIDLASVVDQAIEEVRPLIEARRHNLKVNMAQDPIHVEADPTRLAQVFGNLLNNAAKYTEEGGQIELEFRREAKEAVISVRDNGVGIPAELLPRVFDLFTQSDRTLDRSQGGLGIGLTLVRRLVQMHSGTVHASSEGAGRGSEFIVRIPAVSENSIVEASRPAASTTPPAPSSYHSILIVDDNVDAADSLAMLLELSGHQVTTAYGWESAIKAAANNRPRVILLDIGLPGMDGYEVARRLRQNPDLSGTTLVALTGYGQEEDRRKSRIAGFDHHLIKPVELGELTRLLAELGT